MAYWNQLNCQSRAGNLGIGKCSTQNAPTRAIIFAPKGAVITAANAADLQTFLSGKFHATNYADRWHIFGPIVEISNNDAEASTTEFQDGSQYTNRPGYYRTGYRHTQGDCLHASLRQFDGRQGQFDVFEVDNQGRLIAINTTDANGVEVLGGQALSRIEVPNKMKATFADAPAYWVNLDFADADTYNEQYATMPIQDKSGKSFDILTFAQIQSVQDAKITAASALTAGVVQLAFLAGCGQLAIPNTITAGMLNVFNSQTLAAITLTSLTPIANSGGLYTATFDTTDTDYPTTGQQLSVAFKDVATNAALGLTYYESNTLKLTV